MIKETKTKDLTVCLMLIMVVQAIRYFPFKFGGWNQIQLSFSYEYGFIQRGFLGTILSLMSKLFHIPWGYMRYVHAFLTMGTFTFLMVFITYTTLEKGRLESYAKSFLTGLSLVFFMGPGWSTNYSNFALMELWLPILSVLGIYFLVKGKMLWCIPVIAIVCELIHTGYVFLYFNLILVVFFYKIFLDSSISAAIKRRYIISGVITFVLTSALFLYMMFFACAKDGTTLEYVVNRAAEFTSKPVEEIELQIDFIQGYLFRNGGSSGIELYIKDYWLLLFVMIVMFAPFIYEIYRYWSIVARRANEAGRKGILYALVPLGTVTTVPMYIMHCDYGRWTYAVFFYEFACIWLFNTIKDEAVLGAASEMMQIISGNKLYYMVLLFYAAVSGAYAQNLVNPMIAMIESYGWEILEAVGL